MFIYINYIFAFEAKFKQTTALPIAMRTDHMQNLSQTFKRKLEILRRNLLYKERGV